MSYKLSFILYRASKDIIWESPGTVVRTLIRNKLVNDPFFMSHIDIRLTNQDNEVILAGMRRVSNLKFYFDLILGKFGMELITEVYPGDLFSEEKIKKNIQFAKNKKRLKQLHFIINEQVATRLIEYFTDYKKRNYHKQYSGFLSNPFLGEGAGCIAFALSFLKVAGLLDQNYIQAWSRDISIPHHLFAENKSKQFISLFGYALGKNGRWASPEEKDASHLKVFDPQLVYEWIEKNSSEDEMTLDFSQHIPPSDDYWEYSWY
jgi:hypothetical protein